MSCKSSSFLGTVLLVLVPLETSADFESRLLEKFKNQNQAAADKLKQDVAGILARTQSLGQSDPAQLLIVVKENLRRLKDDYALPKSERLSLTEKLAGRLEMLKQLVAEKEKKEALEKEAREKEEMELARATAEAEESVSRRHDEVVASEKRKRVDQAFASNSSFAVTPVASADRRYVRISVAGTFSFARPVQFPVQFAVPTVLYGPGNRFTVGRPEGILTVMGTRPTFTSLGLGTTVMVPDGGTAVLGGFGSAADGRSEFGAPLLGGIPYLSRGFRNVGTGRTISRTGASVSVRIISMEEMEQAFLHGR
jgi:type II secretory pathway component GspD/PulD (secretin)